MPIAESFFIKKPVNLSIYFSISFVLSSPSENSIPVYRSSVFSLTIIKSTLEYLVFTPLYSLQGLKHAYKSRDILKRTLTDLNPLPTGVLIGPFMATLFFVIELKTWSGRTVPNLATASSPAICSSHSMSTPVASIHRLAARLTSLPMPSPGINVTLCDNFKASVFLI